MSIEDEIRLLRLAVDKLCETTGLRPVVDAVLARPVGSMTLSVRARHCLADATVVTIGDLVVKTEADLLRMRHMGRGTVKAISTELRSIGLRLGMRIL